MNLLSFFKARVFKLYEDFEMKNYSELEYIEHSAEEQLAKINQSMSRCNDSAKNEIHAKIMETANLGFAETVEVQLRWN